MEQEKQDRKQFERMQSKLTLLMARRVVRWCKIQVKAHMPTPHEVVLGFDMTTVIREKIVHKNILIGNDDLPSRMH